MVPFPSKANTVLPALNLGSYKVRREALNKFRSDYEGKDLTDPDNIGTINNSDMTESHL